MGNYLNANTASGEIPAIANQPHRHNVSRWYEGDRCHDGFYINSEGIRHHCPYIPSPLAKYVFGEEDEELDYEQDPAIRPDWQSRIGMTLEEVAAGRRRNSVLEDMTDTERIAAMEARFLRMKKFVNEAVAEINKLEARITALEAKLKTFP